MELTQAQTVWQTEFNRRVVDVETHFHYWENAQDRRRANRFPEEQDRLDHDATVKGNVHSDAMRYLTEWVQAHPYPVADQTADTKAQTVADGLREANRLAQIAAQSCCADCGCPPSLCNCALRNR